jgi:hypothetical protein
MAIPSRGLRVGSLLLFLAATAAEASDDFISFDDGVSPFYGDGAYFSFTYQKGWPWPKPDHHDYIIHYDEVIHHDYPFHHYDIIHHDHIIHHHPPIHPPHWDIQPY